MIDTFLRERMKHLDENETSETGHENRIELLAKDGQRQQ
jgi:hypothetical protein